MKVIFSPPIFAGFDSQGMPVMDYFGMAINDDGTLLCQVFARPPITTVATLQAAVPALVEAEFSSVPGWSTPESYTWLTPTA